MKAVITNLAPISRQTWVQVAVPRAMAAGWEDEATFVSDLGHRFRAVRGRSHGMTSTIFRAHATLEPNQTLRGDIVNEAHPDVAPFQPHPWTTDSVQALFPKVAINYDGAWHMIDEHKVELVDSSPAHQRWLITGSGGGFVLRWYADVLHHDPVVQCWGMLVWSDRNDRRLDLLVDGIALRTGELFCLDFATRSGVAPPVRVGNEWVMGLSGPLGFIDGSGIPLIGRMATFIGGSADLLTPDLKGDGGMDMSSLHAALLAPALGMGTEFDGQFIACLWQPRLRWPLAQVVQEAENQYQGFLGLLGQPASWYVTRRYGLSMTPSQTGNQSDFAATAGTWALAASDPRHLWEYGYCGRADAFRGICHFEADGSILRAENHPQCVTWSGYPHQAGSDFLGKDRPIWGSRRATGWIAYDDEHRSQNTLGAYAALSDDPIADEIIEHQVEIDLMSHRHVTGAGDATRAQGRMIGCWAQLVSQAGGEVKDKLMVLIARKHLTSKTILDGQDPNYPMRVLSTIDPDARKPVFDPETHQLLPTTSMWELGLALIGFRLCQNRGEPVMDDILEPLCQTIARYGTFEDGGNWTLVADVAWFGGADHPEPVSATSPYIIPAGSSGVGGWVVAGMLVAADVLQDADLKAKARACVRRWTGGEEANDRQQAEWWAIVQSIASVSS